MKNYDTQFQCTQNTCYSVSITNRLDHSNNKFLASLRNKSASTSVLCLHTGKLFMAYKISKHKTYIYIVTPNSGYLCHQFNRLRVEDSGLENCFCEFKLWYSGLWHRQKNTRCHNPEHHNQKFPRPANLKSQVFLRTLTKCVWFLSSGFRGWSSMCDFGLRRVAASNVEGYPAFRQMLQLPSSGWMCIGWVFLKGDGW
jgi:hypothetical protein